MFTSGSNLLQCLPDLPYKSKHSEAEPAPVLRHRASHAVQLNPDIQLALDIAREQLPRRITNLPIASSDEMLPLVREARPAFVSRIPKPVSVPRTRDDRYPDLLTDRSSPFWSSGGHTLFAWFVGATRP